MHVRVICNNVTVIAYNNNIGGIKRETCNNIARRIWNFCIEYGIFALKINFQSQQHIIEPDQQSRILNDATEQKLHPELYKIVDKFGKADIDLFEPTISVWYIEL